MTTKSEQPPRLMGAIEQPESAKARLLDDDEIEKILAAEEAETTDEEGEDP